MCRLLRASLLNTDPAVFNFYLDKIASEEDETKRERMQIAADEGDPESEGDTPLMEVSPQAEKRIVPTSVICVLIATTTSSGRFQEEERRRPLAYRKGRRLAQ